MKNLKILIITFLNLKIEKKLKEKNISWTFLVYKKNLFSSFTNIFKGFLLSLIISLNKKIKFYHIRSYIPGLMILIFITLLNRKFIFDMRGFWIDEKADRSNLNKKKLKYIFFKYIEKILVIKSSNLITLTNESKNILKKNFPHINKNKISVIPTCVQTDIFYPMIFKQKNISNIIFCYLGSIDTAYDINKVIYQFKMFLKIDNNIFLKIITNSQKEKVLKIIESFKLNKKYFSIQRSNHSEINKLINKSHVGIFYANNNFSIKASFPTKIGEFFSCGKPIICNNFNKDINQIITKNNIGIISDFDDKNSVKDFIKLKKIIINNNTKKRLKNFVDNNLSIEIGVKKYLKIYNQL